MEGVDEFALTIVYAIEVTGIAVILAGMIVSAAKAGRHLLTAQDTEGAYRLMRRGLGQSLILGIDFLIASEIIRSISAETLDSIAVLGATVVVRIFLSFTIAIDVEGRLPWRRGEE